jgi:pimeloyl-ACP methyl ester carboxylesterase
MIHLGALLLTTVFFSGVILQKSAQAHETQVSLNTGNGLLVGTFLSAKETPEAGAQVVALIIAGSGPTDRNGNNPSMINNSLKMLAEGLQARGISSLRFDKRGVAASAEAALSEQDLRFEDYIEDTMKWVDYIKNTLHADKIIIIGHSEGALIGAVAARHAKVDKFVSLAGAGEPVDLILRKQLASEPSFVLDAAIPILNSLLSGKTVDSIPTYLNALFRPSVQPYLISWFKYDPRQEIAKLRKPVLIIQGTSDLQVNVKDAQMLYEANPEAKLIKIEGMNHVLKPAPLERQANIETYSQGNLPIKQDVLDAIAEFSL